MKKFVISTAKPYNIYIGNNILGNVGQLLRDTINPCKVALITDTTVNTIYSQTLITSLIEHGFQVSKIIFPSGEHSKNLNTYGNILEALADEGISRSDVIVALGGGVVGDMSGFVAATYMRGIRCIQVPTTYIATIDASVGGKTGLNLLSGKNLVGAFWQPSLVICDYKTFNTLPNERLMDGVSEALKHAFTSDAGLIPRVISNDYEYVIDRCISIKKSVVEADERDTGLRQILNFGHTVGHAIEKLSSYAISHGQAVAKGMAAEAKACEAMKFSPAGTYDKISEVLTEAGFDLSINYSPHELYQYALLDKKISGGKITIVIPLELGKCQLRKISVPELEEFLSFCC